MSETKTSKADLERLEMQKQIKDLKKANEEKEMKLANLDNQKAVQQADETTAVIENLQRQIEEIRRSSVAQPAFNAQGKKEKYRPVTPDDVGDEHITFTARCVLKVIPGYQDENGMEVLPPHKIITMNFAASDIRQDGKEENILNFCSYSTNLISEINFLRAHPEHGLTFGENMNEVAGQNPKDYEFRTRAADQVSSMSTESIIGYMKMLKVHYHKKTNKQMKDIIVAHLVKEYQSEANDLQDALKTRILEQAAKVRD